jgi:predicted RNase H-like nuclease (RuvC/YqgF family)
MTPEEKEQNKRINQHQRLIVDLREPLKTIETDVEPDGRISEAFEHLSSEIDEFKAESRKRFDRLEHKVNQLGSKLDIIIEHLTNINDLPEE